MPPGRPRMFLAWKPRPNSPVTTEPPKIMLLTWLARREKAVATAVASVIMAATGATCIAGFL